MLRKMRKNQSGFILIYVTLTLAIAMIILPALLLFIGGAGRTAQIREDRMLQVYAADAGIEKAFHEIVIQSFDLPVNPTDDAWVGKIGDVSDLSFNDNYVDIKVYKEGEESGVYRILSTATNWEGISTTIECYTAVQDSWSLFDNALTSYNDIYIKNNNVEIDGPIALGKNGAQIGNGWDDYGNEDRVRDEPTVYWPDAETLIAYYQQYVGNCSVPKVTPFPNENLDVANDSPEWPLLRCGDLNLDTKSKNASFKLGNTTYVSGNLTIPNDAQFTLDLNNQTIFCEGNIEITGKCNIIGNGCIVALGDVDFSPKAGTEEGKFVFIMSVNGTVTLAPMGDFYGSLAGNILIEVKSGSGAKVEWVDYEEIGFLPNFPTEDEFKLPAIISYTILDEEPE